jgi:hypothetical protein
MFRERRNAGSQRRKQMNTFHTDSIAASVQLAVAAWFLVAAGAILADPVSPYTQRPVPAAVAQAAPARPTQLAQAPKARYTITVSASRTSTGTVTTYSL